MPEPRWFTASEILARVKTIKRDTLRRWREQHYIEPKLKKTLSGNHYFYSEDQVAKIELMAQLTHRGVSPQRAAERAEAELAAKSDAVGHPKSSAQPHLGDCADGDEVAKLLRALALRTLNDPVIINNRFRAWLATQTDPKWNNPKVRVGTMSDSSPDFLQNALAGCQLTFIEARSVADNYGIHSLLLDSLFSHIHRTPPLYLGFADDFIGVGDPRDRRYGSSVQYRVPWTKLANTDTAIGLLELQPGGKSDVHSHPGDEIILVIKGQVVVRLEDFGTDTTIREGDLIHYYAEQTHSASNISQEVAEIVIIRYYQLENEGIRRKIDKAIQAWSGNLGSGKTTELAPLILSLLKAVPSVASPAEGADYFQDPVDLGRFLSQARRCFGLTIDDISQKSGRPTDYHLRLEAGAERVAKADLPSLARLYQLEEVLLHHYLSPAVLTHVVLRDLMGPNPGKDLSPITGSGVRYWIPRRTLMYSDIQVALVELDRGGKCPTHKHRGFELLLPFSGKFTLSLQGHKEMLVDGGKQGCVHFPSEGFHSACGVSEETARFLVLRFFH